MRDVELTERFADAVVRDPFRLDEVCALVGAHGDRSCDVDATIVRLDDLAATVRTPTLDGVLGTLFGEIGLTGDRTTYADPRNSYLHHVLERRTGIPITLSVVLMEVGRRVGITIEGIGTPAHFVARAPGDPDRYVDAFDGGRVMDRAGLGDLFARVAPGIDLAPHLSALGGPDIVRRVLSNLVVAHRRRGDRQGLLWATQLRTLVPGSTPEDHRTYGGALASSGDFVRAAKVLESIVADGRTGDPESELAQAQRLRARLN